jgi:outer membrane murein-binding lipoprotein Lpp
MQHFSLTRFDFIVRRLSYFRSMTPVAQVVLVLCAVVLTVAMVVTLASIRRAATRAETVLQLVEREIRPLASQVEGLAAEVRTLSQTANQELQRVSGVIRRGGAHLVQDRAGGRGGKQAWRRSAGSRASAQA